MPVDQRGTIRTLYSISAICLGLLFPSDLPNTEMVLHFATTTTFFFVYNINVDGRLCAERCIYIQYVRNIHIYIIRICVLLF